MPNCDPLNLFTGASKLLESITDMSLVKVDAIDDLLAMLKETRKRIVDYEERVKPLPDARTTWVPSMLTKLTNEEVLMQL